MKRLGRFGEFAKEYEKARRGYPPEVFVLLKKLLQTPTPQILDLGCGTGISTRQLAKYAKVTGCDPDPLMLKAAKRHTKINGEKYVIGEANKLPFKDSVFDAVTAFSAFHWFDNKISIAEIKRVLKPGGIIFVVNKTGLKSWGQGYRKTIIKTLGREVAKFREDSYDPKKSLATNGLKKLTVRTWKQRELFNLDNALEYVQSVSIWNSVPANLREMALNGLRKYFKDMKKQKGKIERKLTVKVVVGGKE